MNLAETNDLLTFIASYDNRRFDDATVLAWHPIFVELPLDDCLSAVTEHFGTSDIYLMPVHVRRIVDAVHRERRRILREEREAAEQRALEARPTTDRSAELRAAIRDMLPPGDPDKLRRAEWVEADRRRERLANAEPNPLYDPAVAAAAAEDDDPLAGRKSA